MAEKRTLGLALCGSYCTYETLFAAAAELAEHYDLIPIMSDTAAETDSRFGTARSFRIEIENLCGRPVLSTIPEVEPIGPQGLLDVLVLAHGITDSAVTMAAKAHLRNGRPVILALSTNDGLSGSAENIARLLNRKHIYFVPFGQDAPGQKPCSLQADFQKLCPAVEAALEGRQLQPILK